MKSGEAFALAAIWENWKAPGAEGVDAHLAIQGRLTSTRQILRVEDHQGSQTKQPLRHCIIHFVRLWGSNEHARTAPISSLF
jgi:hypothetical protein